jgi:hypothetical protein
MVYNRVNRSRFALGKTGTEWGSVDREGGDRGCNTWQRRPRLRSQLRGILFRRRISLLGGRCLFRCNFRCTAPHCKLIQCNPRHRGTRPHYWSRSRGHCNGSGNMPDCIHFLAIQNRTDRFHRGHTYHGRCRNLGLRRLLPLRSFSHGIPNRNSHRSLLVVCFAENPCPQLGLEPL